MNNKGSVAIYGLMVGLVIFILAMALAPVGKEFIDSARSNSTEDAIGLGCTNQSISNFDKAACIVSDFSLVYFFGGLILI